jgi:hypothetical protein
MILIFLIFYNFLSAQLYQIFLINDNCKNCSIHANEYVREENMLINQVTNIFILKSISNRVRLLQHYPYL